MSDDKKPAIRFKDYSDDWEQRKLGELVEIGDIDHRMPETVADGIPYLMTGDFIATNELNFDGVKMISEEDYCQLSQKIKPEKGDILFARYSSVGAARYVDFTREFLISYSCAIIKKSRKINSKYLYHFITSNNAQRQIKLEINTGSQANIGIDSMKNNIVVSTPSTEEQTKIADVLSNLDYLITLHQRKYDKLQNLKKAMLEKMFPKNGSNVPEIRFKGFTDAWEQRKVGDYYEFKNGLNKSKEFFGEGTPIVNFTDVFHNRGIFLEMLSGKVRLELSEIKNYEVKKGDIFFTRTSETIEEIGYPSVMLGEPENTVFSGFVLRGRCFLKDDPLDNLFKKYLFFTDVFRTEMLRKSSMTTRALTSGTAIKNMEFLHPLSKEEQHRIGELLTKLDHLITLHQRELEKLKNIKKALLEKMFV